MTAANLKLAATLELIDKITAPFKSITAQSEKATKAFRDTRDQVKKLEAETKKLGKFRSLQKGLKDTTDKLKAAKDRVSALEKQYSSAARPTKRLTKQLEAARMSVGRLTDSFDDQTRQLRGLENKLKSAGYNLKDIATHEHQLKKQISAANRELDRQREKMSKIRAIQNKMKKQKNMYGDLRNKGAMVAGTGALAGAGMLRAYSTAESSGVDLQASMMSAGGKIAPEFREIEAIANRLGMRLPGSVADFNLLMNELVTQGIKYKDIVDGTGEAAANFAVVMKMDFVEAARAAAKLQDSTRTSAVDMEALMDEIQRARYLGAEVDYLQQAFSKGAPALNNMRKSGLAAVKDLNPLFAMMNQKGMEDGGAVGNAWRKFTSAGLDTSMIEAQAKKLSEITGRSITLDFTDGKGGFGSVENALAQLEQLKDIAPEYLNPALEKMFGNNSELQTLVSNMMNSGVDGYQDAINRMEAQASMQERVQIQLGTLANTIDAAQGTFVSVLSSFIEPIAPQLKDFVNWLTQITEKVGNWTKANPELAGWITKIAGIVIIAAGALSIFSAVMLAVLGPLALLKASLVTLGLPATLMPFTLLKNGVFGAGRALMFIFKLVRGHPLLMLATAVYLIWKNWDSIFNMLPVPVQNALTSVKSFFTNAMEWFRNLSLKDIGYAIIEGLATGMVNAALAPIRAAANIANRIKSAFTSKKAMDINSPSRVFAKYGDFTMQGLAQGILRNTSPQHAVAAQADQLRTQASGIRFDNRSPIRHNLAQQSNTPSQNTFHFHIHAAKGQSENDIAKLVAAKVSQALNGQSDSSALYDSGEAF